VTVGGTAQFKTVANCKSEIEIKGPLGKELHVDTMQINRALAPIVEQVNRLIKSSEVTPQLEAGMAVAAAYQARTNAQALRSTALRRTDLKDGRQAWFDYAKSTEAAATQLLADTATQFPQFFSRNVKGQWQPKSEVLAVAQQLAHNQKRLVHERAPQPMLGLTPEIAQALAELRTSKSPTARHRGLPPRLYPKSPAKPALP
jgi:hypothetical protein